MALAAEEMLKAKKPRRAAGMAYHAPVPKWLEFATATNQTPYFAASSSALSEAFRPASWPRPFCASSRAVPPDSIVNGIGTFIAVAPERSRAMYCGRRSSPCDVTPRHSAKRILSVKSAASSAESPAARLSETEKSRSTAVSMRSLIREPPLRRRARVPRRGRAGALRADTAPAFPSRWRPAAPCARRPPPSAVSRGRRERCCRS